MKRKAVVKATIASSKPGGTVLAACVQHDMVPVTAADTAWCVDLKLVESVRSNGSAASRVSVLWWCEVDVGMLTQKCHEANDTSSFIFRIVTCRLSYIPTCFLSKNETSCVLCPLPITAALLPASDTQECDVTGSWPISACSSYTSLTLYTPGSLLAAACSLCCANAASQHLFEAQHKRTNILAQSTLSSWNLYEQCSKHSECITQ